MTIIKHRRFAVSHIAFCTLALLTTPAMAATTLKCGPTLQQVGYPAYAPSPLVAEQLLLNCQQINPFFQCTVNVGPTIEPGANASSTYTWLSTGGPLPGEGVGVAACGHYLQNPL
jgi:hypothetical protein